MTCKWRDAKSVDIVRPPVRTGEGPMMRHREKCLTNAKPHSTALTLGSVNARWLLSVVGLALVLAVPRPIEAVTGNCGGTQRNCVTEWNKVAEETLTVFLPIPRPFQNEGLIYMAYVSAAV